jgi:hypothetical protein
MSESKNELKTDGSMSERQKLELSHQIWGNLSMKTKSKNFNPLIKTGIHESILILSDSDRLDR